MKKNENLYSADFFRGIAHRGLHDETCTENGLKAFEKAIEKGKAFEFDIHLTKDGELVVCHDSYLQRVTGKEGIIEDLKLEEIKKNYRLLDGEEIPTLKEVYDLNKDRQTMVVELKPFEGNHKMLAQMVIDFFRKNPAKNVVFICFYPQCLWPLKKLKKPRQLLVCQAQFNAFAFRHFFEGVDVEYTLLEREEVKKYAANHVVNVWTIKNAEEYKVASKICDTVTYELFDIDSVVVTKEENS